LLDSRLTKASATSGLVRAVSDSSSFREANHRASKLARITKWRYDDVERLRRALAENKQVSGAFHAAPRIREILKTFDFEEAPF
jgi:hypothetical protein